MSNLYKDAILDAKALRASAIANAKSALEEAFGPKIEAIVRKSLSEEMKEEEVEEGWDKKKMHEEDGEMTSEMEDINEEELDEILNQLEEMSDKKDDKEDLKEAEEGEDEAEGDDAEGEEDAEGGEEGSEEGEETEGSEEGEEEAGEEAEEEVDDETKIVDITLGDLKQVIQSLMPAGGEEAPAGEELGGEEATEGGEEAEEEAEVSLDEILDELEAEGAEGIGHYDSKDSNDTDPQGTEQHFGGRNGDVKELHFQSFIKTPGQGGKDKEVKEGDKEGARDAFGDAGKVKYNEAAKKELKEARATINTLRKELQEVNLLNAKFLYMNKLFKGKALNETQKMRVINAMDRATSVKEVKLTFEALSESLKTARPAKRSITEGFASKPAGVAPKANIVEAEQFVSRWQKLAGIKK